VKTCCECAHAEWVVIHFRAETIPILVCFKRRKVVNPEAPACEDFEPEGGE